ncbi:uncharacterized protein si:dkeyp-97b10.3 isoform X1 [Chiloscyllium plagiosum]|uniref:uncharacterized protein si:dkeyp-97b10.3 isoform X1 n=1 Tax=Chiloscyllium plagiosum TaxID=36176 RepID=UPI001CB7F881|nr:uncharacterized protein si:dkeyp-97b10.3 isoform X1 [Chiloscyllium plagiosum]
MPQKGGCFRDCRGYYFSLFGEERTPTIDLKEQNPDIVENSESGSDDEGSSESGKSESEHRSSDSSEAELDANETTAEDGQPNNNPEQAADDPSLPRLPPENCRTEETTTNPSDTDLYVKPSCPSCNCQTNQNFEQVPPRQISKDRFCMKLDHEGSYQCVATGLVFEVTGKVDIIYSILSWYKYDTFLKEKWKLCGPLFEVKSDPALLKSIYFPHSLCLSDHSADLQFGILHIKDKKPKIEPVVDHSTTHVHWNVSSLSPVGPICNTPSDVIQHHGVVLIYKIINSYQSLLFHVYMATNNHSVIKDITKAEKYSKQKSVKIDKPTPCHKKLITGKTYRLLSNPQADITPGEIAFEDMTPLKCKGYFEVFLEQPEDFQLTLMDVDSGETMWTSKLRECDWAHHDQDEQGKPRDFNKNRRRKSSNDNIMEESSSKRSRWNDTIDGPPCNKNNTITEKQLMQFAEKLGSNWQVFAISCLDLQSQDIDKIKDQNASPTMQIFYMLQKWKNNESGNATPSNLRKKLIDANIEPEARILLEGFCNQ